MPAQILIVDDRAVDRRQLALRLQHDGHVVLQADSGPAALALAAQHPPDLVMLDVMMPGMDGFEVCRRLRAMPALRAVPVVLLTMLDGTDHFVRGLEAGADDFISKPFDSAELQARVRSLLRVKLLFDEVQRQSAALADAAATLERRVADAVAQVERLSRLQRFFSPRLAARLVGDAGDAVLRSHRAEVTVLFVDLRGFTAFAEHASADAVMALLADFHATMGGLIYAADGTIERFTGDGLMVFFNDPDPVPDHSAHAVRLALAMQAQVAVLARDWQALGGPLGVGIGISRGMATLGAVGFEGRLDYAAIGSVTNLAARLCAEAAAGETLVCSNVQREVVQPRRAHEQELQQEQEQEQAQAQAQQQRPDQQPPQQPQHPHGASMRHVVLDALPPLELKGFAQPVPVWRVRDAAASTITLQR